MNKLLQNINNFALLLFVFGVNFEYWDPFGLQGVFSIAKMTAIVYFASWIPFLEKVKLKPLGYFLTPLLGYLFVEFLSSVINNEYATSILSTFNLNIVQLLLLLILITNHIYSNPKILNWILYVFISNVVLLSILSSQGIGVEIGYTAESRLIMFGENPNSIGMKAAFALVMLLYFIFNSKGLWAKFALGMLIVPILSMLMATASRGALLSVFVGLGVMIMIKRASSSRKILLFIVGISASTWLLNYVMTSNELFAERMDRFIEEGHTGRNEIWDAAYNIIQDNFIIGVGRPGALPVMQQYYGQAMDPHNVFLYVFITTGVVGFLFFMTFIYRLGYRLFKHFRKTNNVLYLVLFAILIFIMSKAGGFINKTFLWFFFALLIGSTFNVPNNKRIKNVNT